MQCTVKLYYDTKFDAANIPDSPALLQSFSSKAFSSVYVKQDRELISLKIEALWEDVKNADYCAIQDGSRTTQFYFITGIEMLNDNVAKLSLLEDTITSVGGVNALTFIDGWCTRLTVGEDEIFSNVLEESFTPAKPLVITDITHIGPVVGSADTDAKLICTTCDLLDFDLTADTYTSEGGSVTVPRMPAVADSTKFVINDIEGNELFKNVISGINTYNYTGQEVKDGVRFARSLGLESIITSCYSVPISYLNQVPVGKINLVKSDIKLTGTFHISDILGYEPQNNKVYNNLVKITIKSIGAQNEATYEPWQICTNAGALYFISYADLSPSGKPYCRPGIYMGYNYIDSKDHFFDTGISGYTWENVPITFTQATDITKRNANISLQSAELQNVITGTDLGIGIWNNQFGALNDLAGIAGGTINTLGSLGSGSLNAIAGAGRGFVSDMGNAANSMLGVVNSIASFATRGEREANMYRQAEMADLILSRERMQYEYNSNVIVPKTMFPDSQEISAYIGNGFYVYATLPSEEDLAREDQYFTRFGYTVSEPLTKEKLFTRQNFNFVQANSVFLDDNNSDVTNRRSKTIEDVFASGVRIWHVKPSREALLTNPIKEVN